MPDYEVEIEGEFEAAVSGVHGKNAAEVRARIKNALNQIGRIYNIEFDRFIVRIDRLQVHRED